MNTWLKLLYIGLAFGALATLSPAPLLHKGKSDSAPATTQQELAETQGLARVQPFVGSSAQSAPKHSLEGDGGIDGADQVTAAGTRLDADHSPQAIDVLKSAEKHIEEKQRSPFFSLLWVAFAACFGYGAFAAFRRWADKNVPESLLAQRFSSEESHEQLPPEKPKDTFGQFINPPGNKS